MARPEKTVKQREPINKLHTAMLFIHTLSLSPRKFLLVYTSILYNYENEKIVKWINSDLYFTFEHFGIVQKANDALALGIDVTLAAEFQHFVLQLQLFFVVWNIRN